MANLIQEFLQGIHSLNAKAIGAPLSSNIVLTDEFRQHYGREDVEAWAQEALVGHQATIKVLDTARVGDNANSDKSVVHVKMDGDFEADYGITDPFDLWMHFDITNNEITRLTINPFPPSTRTVHAVWAASGNLKDPLSSIRTAERPFHKKPADTGHNWVLVKMHSASLNQHDIFTLRGIGIKKLEFPMILGNDGVCWRCEGETSVPVDESQLYLIYNVINSPAWTGDGTLDPDRSVLSELYQGTLSSYAWIPEANLIPIPKLPAGLTPHHVAGLGTAWLAAYRALLVKAGSVLSSSLKPTILVQGSSGGVATALIRLGSALGHTVYVTARTPSKAVFAQQLGATRVFTSDEILTMSLGTADDLPNTRRPIDVVFNLAGGASYSEALKLVRPGGTVIVCGMHAGEPEAGLLNIFGNGLTVQGVYEGTKEELEQLLDFVIDNGIVPAIEEVLLLENAATGVAKLLTSDAKGKIVINMV